MGIGRWESRLSNSSLEAHGYMANDWLMRGNWQCPIPLALGWVGEEASVQGHGGSG